MKSMELLSLGMFSTSLSYKVESDRDIHFVFFFSFLSLVPSSFYNPHPKLALSLQLMTNSFSPTHF